MKHREHVEHREREKHREHVKHRECVKHREHADRIEVVKHRSMWKHQCCGTMPFCLCSGSGSQIFFPTVPALVPVLVPTLKF
jgi:hypothetical protein